MHSVWKPLPYGKDQEKLGGGSSPHQRQSGDGGEGDGEVETVTAEIPVDILRRISPLCEKMGLTIKCYVCYVITLMLCFIYFQRFSVKILAGVLEWHQSTCGMNELPGGSKEVELRQPQG